MRSPWNGGSISLRCGSGGVPPPAAAASGPSSGASTRLRPGGDRVDAVGREHRLDRVRVGDEDHRPDRDGAEREAVAELAGAQRSISGTGRAIRRSGLQRRGQARAGRQGHSPNVLPCIALRKVCGNAGSAAGRAAVVSIGAMATALEDLKLHASGKVREIYEDGDDLIMVASDRISVYDVILPTPIPDKGAVLTQMSLFWFELTEEICRTTSSPRTCRPRPRAAGCGSRGSRCTRSSAWCAATSRARAGRSTRRPARSAGSSCPEGLKESDKLPEPIFTPATKAELGRPRREHRLRPGRRDHRQPAPDGGAAAGLDRDLQARRRARGRARDHPRRHQVRVRQHRRAPRSSSATRS